MQGGSRSQEDVDANLTEERSADHEEHEAEQGEAEMEDEEEVPTSSMNKSMKRFAAVSNLVAAEPPAFALKRRINPHVSLKAKKAVVECGEAPAKKRAVGRPVGKAGSRVNLSS